MPLILSRRALSIATKGQRFMSARVPINAKTAEITVSIARPASAKPVAWDDKSRIRVSIIVEADGVEYRCDGGSTGGTRVNRAGQEIPVYRLSYTLPWGFFGTRSGNPRRLGEGKGAISARVEVELLDGGIDTDVEVTTEIADAPLQPFHSSVAFDAATDAQEVSGDGVLSLTHTSSGSDRAVFAGSGNSSGAGGQASTSITYGGTGMTEMWDIGPAGGFHRSAGYRLAGQATGAQTVTSTLAGATDEYAFGVISMTGVDQTTPVGTPATATGNSATASVTVGSVGTDDLVVDNLWKATGTNTIGADQTQRYVEAAVGGFEDLHGSTQLGSAGGVMSWTFSATDWALGAVNFKAAAGGGGTVLRVPLTGGMRELTGGMFG